MKHFFEKAEFVLSEPMVVVRFWISLKFAVRLMASFRYGRNAFSSMTRKLADISMRQTD